MKEEENHLDHQLEYAERIAYLVAGFIRNTLTPAEHDELDKWVEASPDNMKLFEQLTDESHIARGLSFHQRMDTQEALKRLKQKIGHPALSPRRMRRCPLVAAAALLLAVAGLLFLLPHRVAPPRMAIKAQPPYKAVLQIANGAPISLDQAPDGNLAVQGNTQVVKDAGTLAYNRFPHLGIRQQTVENLLRTERGGRFTLILPDGSKVWLNAASAISFPSAFTGRVRKVVVWGEAYFEVAEDAARPFQVWAGDTKIEVLGTHFNVNAYGDEPMIKAALIEGSVRVARGGIERLLRPGEEAQVSSGAIRVVPANEAQVTGWREGHLVFSHTPLYTVARELSRWYEADISCSNSKSLHVTITIERELPLQKVMQLLEGTGEIHFRQEGQKLVME